MKQYPIREGGRNGTVEITDHAIVRTFKRTFGKADTQTIPITSVRYIELDRRRLLSDELIVHVGTLRYVWKTPYAQELASNILARK